MDNKNILVTYFSCTGTTENIAKKIARITNADIFEIKPQIPYTKEDLDFDDSYSRSTLEVNNPASRPAIDGKVGQMERYDVVFLGFPIWWYHAPKIINTFLEQYNFSGKKVIPFATSGGTDIDVCEEKLHDTYPDSVTWEKGKLLIGIMSEDSLTSWINSAMKIEKYTLYNGVKVPVIGLGTWKVINEMVAKESVKAAIKAGYRNIDTAQAYHNEESVGLGIREAMKDYNIKREELFISTKVWNTHRGYNKTMGAFQESLDKLGLEYIDLYMIHWPAVEKCYENWREINHDTWSALEDLYKTGRVKAIGVSNFLKHHLEALIKDSEIKPMVNQIEYHPGFGQVESANFCMENDILVEAWSPFGTGDVLDNEVLKNIGNKYNKQPAHICLRWLLQKNMLPLPKSVRQERVVANIDVFDFELTLEEMKQIDNIPYCGGMKFNPDEAQS